MSMRWASLVTDTPDRRGAAGTDPEELGRVFDAVRAELGVRQDFPPEALSEAHAVAARPALPSRDETSLPFLTIGRPGSTDVDQALLIERAGRGYRVRYATADVTAFVRPGGQLDGESLRRGQTIYAPDGCAPLYPEQLTDDAASLLPGQVRPAFVWDVQLDPDGEGTSAEVYRAMISSRDRLGFAQVQDAIEGGTADSRLSLLKEVGERRIAMEWARGGASLPIPVQEIRVDGDGNYDLALRPPLPAQDWTVQISLMIGIAAAEMMLHAEVGILRTMPPPDGQVIQRFRRQARVLGVSWPPETLYGELMRSLDRANPPHVALMHEAAWLFRGAGAGYAVFDGGVPEVILHEAVAAPYAHVTAPLRRVVDRYGLVVCESICRDVQVPDWVRQGLQAVPPIMAGSDHLADAVERGCAQAVTAAALRHRVGESFGGMIVDVTGGVALVQLRDPLILAPVAGECTAGAEVTVRLMEADVARRRVRFEVVGE
jgi:exoribonuclease R